MLVTLWRWRIKDVGDRFNMLATYFMMVILMYKKLVVQSSHQHISSRTSLTNSDVATNNW